MNKDEKGAGTPKQLNEPSILLSPEVLKGSDKEVHRVASELLQQADPMQYILDTFNTIHIGDRMNAEVLLQSFVSMCIINSNGLHPGTTGGSGKGKSHSCKTMKHLMPTGYMVDTSLSDKAMFYNKETISDKTVVFSDDVEVSDEMQSIIKRMTSDFTNHVEHITVNIKRKGALLQTPKRIVWWLASVDNGMDMQTLNRQIGLGVDESVETDELVKKHQLKLAASGDTEFPDTFEVSVCKELFRNIKAQFVRVCVPFTDRIVWGGGSNRRNLPMFLDMIRVYTLLHYRQRDEVVHASSGDRMLIATIDDFNNAARVWGDRMQTQTFKMNEVELKILRVLTQVEDMDIKGLQHAMSLSRGRLHQILHGNNGSRGLLDKAPELTCDKVSEKDMDSNRTVTKNIYSLHGFDALSSYGKAVYLSEEL